MKKYKCEQCRDTGYYGDNGPGIKGNREYIRCECKTNSITPGDRDALNLVAPDRTERLCSN